MLMATCIDNGKSLTRPGYALRGFMITPGFGLGVSFSGTAHEDVATLEGGVNIQAMIVARRPTASSVFFNRIIGVGGLAKVQPRRGPGLEF